MSSEINAESRIQAIMGRINSVGNGSSYDPQVARDNPVYNPTTPGVDPSTQGKNFAATIQMLQAQMMTQAMSNDKDSNNNSVLGGANNPLMQMMGVSGAAVPPGMGTNMGLPGMYMPPTAPSMMSPANIPSPQFPYAPPQ